MVGANLIDVVHQTVERAAGEFVAIEWDQAGIRGDQGRADVEVQRRRRVDPDFVIGFEGVERFAQLADLVARFELGLQFFQCRAGRQDGKVFEGGGGDEFLGRQRTQFEAQHLIEEMVGGEFQVPGRCSGSAGYPRRGRPAGPVAKLAAPRQRDRTTPSAPSSLGET